jgi:hypothetical protein
MLGLILIAIGWVGLLAFVMSICQAGARGDARDFQAVRPQRTRDRPKQLRLVTRDSSRARRGAPVGRP